MIKVTQNKELEKSIREALKNNNGYCPCRIKHIPENKCMCKEFREQDKGECHCGLYYKE